MDRISGQIAAGCLLSIMLNAMNVFMAIDMNMPGMVMHGGGSAQKAGTAGPIPRRSQSRYGWRLERQSFL